MIINPNAEKYKGKWTLVSLEPGTCTATASTYFISNFFEEEPDLKYTKTFKEGQEIIRENPNHVMLIPDLHWMSKILIKLPGYQSQKLFELENPPVYLAKNPRSKRDDMTLVTLKTLEGLVSEFQIDEKVGDIITGFTLKSPYDLFYTNNTQDAARLVAEDKATYCITNKCGLEKYELESVRRFDYSVKWFGIHFDPTKVNSKDNFEAGFYEFLARCRESIEEYRMLV